MELGAIEIMDQNGTNINIDALELIENNSVIIINLDSNYLAESWRAGDTLFINNLILSNFNDPTDTPYNLEISALGDNTYHDLDMYTIQIGRPKLIIVNNQTFLYNDIERPIEKISIYDDPLVNTIYNENGILIVLPVNYPATWIVPDNIEFSGSYSGDIDSMLVKGINKDTLQIYISDDFLAGDSIIFSNIETTSIPEHAAKEDSINALGLAIF